ncbi:MAG: hypothetical protein PVG76_05235 [Chromatiales bacterium]|jgi:mannose-6-phosphate isomerase-like protein (cupin superfamily)
MTRPTRFNPSLNCVGVTRDLEATLVSAQPDPAVAVTGPTIGIATMTKNAPHGGEMHPDGDEVLYLISGSVNVVFEDETIDATAMKPGECLVGLKQLNLQKRHDFDPVAELTNYRSLSLLE